MGVSPRWGSVPATKVRALHQVSPNTGVRPRWGSVAVTNVHALRTPRREVGLLAKCSFCGGQSPLQTCTLCIKPVTGVGSDPGGGQSLLQKCTRLVGTDLALAGD